MDNCVETALFGTVCDSCDGGAIYKILALIVKILSTGVGVLAVLGIIIGGVIYLTSAGDASRMAKAKTRITEVVIGLVVYGVMFTVLEFLIPGGVLNSTLDSSTTSCPQKQEATIATETKGQPQQQSQTGQATADNPNPYMTDLIGRSAAIMAWPVQKWQEPYDPYYDTAKSHAGQTFNITGRSVTFKYYGDDQVGKCFATKTQTWETYRDGNTNCATTDGSNRGRPTYDAVGLANRTGPYASCDRFVSATIYSLGLNDGSSTKGTFPLTGPTGMGNWFAASSNWKEITNDGDISKLLPGDVLSASQVGETYGHVAIYIGSYGGSYGSLAEASSGGRYPRVTKYLESAYLRKSGGKTFFGASNSQPYRIFRYIGPTTEAAKSSLFASE